ncbi:WD repeat-containing protein 44-like [Dorcoceras hygrometricum]|uniref:WD repeat-containing protein 44-like n=1 Tax=Dorcoceras hygrometricum TaxID=472368 RepID=A0A2Z7BGD3_9LAMI|nr:WD repeat-containing protein 44-like [Dorcoceras hygrometricum]
MDSFSDLEEGSRFFDALEQISPTFDCVDGCSGYKGWEYDVWVSSPQSIDERRRKFARWMGLNEHGLEGRDSVDNHNNSEDGGVFRGNVGRVMQNSGAVLRTSGVEDEFSSSRSSLSSWSTDDLDLFSGVDITDGRISCGISDGGSECCVDKCGGNKRPGKSRHTIPQAPISGDSKNGSQSPQSVQKLEQRVLDGNGNVTRTMTRSKGRWFSKLRSLTCMVSMNMRNGIVESSNLSQVREGGAQRVGVRNHQRRLKELSALFREQDFQAHEGSILAMKFSPDGQFLASAGEDKLVRVWQVVEDKRSDTLDVADVDPSCVYFSVNHLSELGLLTAKNESVNKSKNLKKTPDSACIIFPSKVFRILEKPLHVFPGHEGDVLDLSWSNNDCLLSSSVDKTVRLWSVGLDRCLKVFSHTDYVTCIQFNPVNDDYFISGSIDGKVRIWETSGRHVVSWAETKDIITAISYHPDGQSGVIGSITGTCRYFTVSDNQIQLEAQICLGGKKKNPCRRITGFQFLPQDPSKVLVTCADSQVRLLNGMDVIIKYKGLRNVGNKISASFTSDGKHIVSASEDSNVYMWNYICPGTSTLSQSKTIRSFESFPADASVVVSWSGLKSRNSEDQSNSRKHNTSINSLPFSPSTYFSPGQEFFLESNPKGSATWPEEKLPATISRATSSTMCKSHYKLLRTSCQSSSTSHAWGLVFVTASWDGKIKSFHNYGLPIPP